MASLLKPPLYRDWRSLSLNVLWCYEHSIHWGSSPSAPVDSSRKYGNNGAWLVREGWAKVEHDDQHWHAEPGQWLIPKPGHRRQRFAKNTKLLSVAFDARWPDGTAWLDSGLSCILDSADYPAIESRGRPLARIMKRISPDSWLADNQPVTSGEFLQLESAFVHWLQALASALADQGILPSRRDAVDARVLRAIRLIQGMPLAERFDRSALASEVGVCAVHLDRLFRRHLGVTPSAYREAHRIEQAKRCLTVPGTRVKEVASDLGFKHLSHFSRWFVQHAGQSPRQYQQDKTRIAG